MITREDIEKAFSEPVPYLLCTFKEDDRTGLREPTSSEVKGRLLALLSQQPQSKERELGDHAKGCEGRNYTCSCGYDDALRQRLSYLQSWHLGSIPLLESVRGACLYEDDYGGVGVSENPLIPYEIFDAINDLLNSVAK